MKHCEHVPYTPNGERLVSQLIVRMQHIAAVKGENLLACFGQQHQLAKGLKLFGEKGEEAARAELRQLVQRHCYTPVDISTLTESELKKAQRTMMLLSQKSSGEVKGRQVFDGSGTRDYYTREETASPTAHPESCLLYTSPSPRDLSTSRMPSSA